MSAPAPIVELPVAPHSIDAEQAVLGGLLIDNGALDRVADAISDQDFYRDDHRRIFRHIVSVIGRSEIADVLTVAESIKATDDRDKTGGISYLAQLAGNTPSAHNVRRYAEIVRNAAQQRALMAIGAELQDSASRHGADTGQLRRELEAKLLEIRPVNGQNVLDWRAMNNRGEPPPRSWAIETWIPMAAPTLLAGPGGVGKTRLALQMGASLALGRDFIDRIPNPMRVLVWACEDDADELERIMFAVSRWLKVTPDAFADRLVVVPRLGLRNTIYAAGEYGQPAFTQTLDELKAQSREVRAQIVFLDNVAQFFGGQAGNNHQVTECINGLMGALPQGAALCMLGHPARAQGSEFSGAAAWENAVRSRLFLGFNLPDQKTDDEQREDDTLRYLCRRKANYSSKDFRRLEYRDGVLVPDPLEADGGIVGHAREQRAESVVLDGLRKLQAMTVRATEGASSQSYLPRLLLDYKLADGQTKPELAAAMRRLRLAGKITSGTVGRYANRTPMTGLVVDEGVHK